MTTKTDILNKITGLLALTASSNEHEAALAARKAAQMMKLHSISEADLEKHQKTSGGAVVSVTVNVPKGEAKSLWVNILGVAIAKSMFCKSLYGYDTVYFVGRHTPATAAAQMLLSLLSAGETMMAADAKVRSEYYKAQTGRVYWECLNQSHNPKKAKRDFRKSFLTGLALAVQAELEKPEEDEPMQNKVTALMVVRDVENDEFISKTWSKLTTYKVRQFDGLSDALILGKKAGQEILSDIKTTKLNPGQ